jgi:hypothetical protein
MVFGTLSGAEKAMKLRNKALTNPKKKKSLFTAVEWKRLEPFQATGCWLWVCEMR